MTLCISTQLHCCRQLPSSYMPAAVSSLTTTAVSIAASTPLPNSDDSDLFESPAESPSQLEENSLHEISKPPKLQLDEDDEISAVQHAPDGSQERFIVEEVMDDFDEEKEDTHRSVEQSVDDLEDKEVPSEATIPTSKAVSYTHLTLPTIYSV